MIPHCTKTKEKKKNFWLRVFGHNFNILQCPEPYENKIEGVFNIKTHGDRRIKKDEKKTDGGKNSIIVYTENNKWFMNPQF